MEFKVDGKSINVTIPINPEVIKEILDKLADGDLMTAKSLAHRLHRNSDKIVRDYVGDHLPEYYAYGKGNTMYLGNKKTIKEYRKQAQVE